MDDITCKFEKHLSVSLSQKSNEINESKIHWEIGTRNLIMGLQLCLGWYDDIICKFGRHLSFFLPWLYFRRIVRGNSYYIKFTLLVA